ncbi:hypothetical protein KJ359_007818 [Pestalotiopsis sp. 9143b]|nr:hypothetical protein KJ359_007818 [Pestalotiopsis sp. 9143b]
MTATQAPLGAFFPQEGGGSIPTPLAVTSEPVRTIDLNGFHWSAVDEEIPQQSDANKPKPQPGQLDRQLGAGKLVESQDKVGPFFPLKQFNRPYFGIGFNMIFRPRASTKDEIVTLGPKDNELQLSLTTEQVTFGGPLGEVPNRGFMGQPGITVTGMPYVQTVQDTSTKPTPCDIHFEPGVWLHVPKSTSPNKDTIVRMATIPHGTTINAQGFVPDFNPKSMIGGFPKAPDFENDPANIVDTTPFFIDPKKGGKQPFDSMKAETLSEMRLPQSLDGFLDKATGITKGRITTKIIKNPNLVLAQALKGLNVVETITFEVGTGSSSSKQPGLSGGGTTNIGFLGAQPGGASSTAEAVSMTAKYWIEVIKYQVRVPETPPGRIQRRIGAIMPAGSTAPTPRFDIKAGPSGIPAGGKVVEIHGIQIQVSQLVLLNFGVLTWPHASVSTLVPTNPQEVELQ